MAACICLFALDKHEAIPVDTHVWQLAVRHYTPHLKGMLSFASLLHCRAVLLTARLCELKVLFLVLSKDMPVTYTA